MEQYSLLQTLLIYVVLFSDKDRCWKLADFGTASQATSKRLNTTRDGRGTQGYRAPEIFGARYNNRSDIFALGCLVYEVVTGAKLFAEDDAIRDYVDSGKLPEATWWPPSPAGKPDRLFYLEKLLASMLELDPINRPNAQKVLESLRIIRDGEFGQSEVLLTDHENAPIQASPVYSHSLRFRDFCPRVSCGRQILAKPLLSPYQHAYLFLDLSPAKLQTLVLWPRVIPGKQAIHGNTEIISSSHCIQALFLLADLCSESQFPNIYKQFQMPQNFDIAPQYHHQIALKAEEEAWKQSSSEVIRHMLHGIEFSVNIDRSVWLTFVCSCEGIFLQ